MFGCDFFEHRGFQRSWSALEDEVELSSKGYVAVLLPKGEGICACCRAADVDEIIYRVAYVRFVMFMIALYIPPEVCTSQTCTPQDYSPQKKWSARSLFDYGFDSASSIFVEAHVDFATDPMFCVVTECADEFC